MDSWHHEMNQYLTTTLYQLETLKCQGGDLAQEQEESGAMLREEMRQREVVIY